MNTLQADIEQVRDLAAKFTDEQAFLDAAQSRFLAAEDAGALDGEEWIRAIRRRALAAFRAIKAE